MTQFPNNTYIFGDFAFDAGKLALYHRGVLLKNTEKKCLQVLAVLIENENQLTSHEEIINKVWKDNSFGVTSLNIAQCISKLRKLFAKYEPDKTFIETEKGRGYIFVGKLVADNYDFLQELPALENQFPGSPDQPDETERQHSPSLFFKNPVFIIIPVILVLLIAWFFYPQNDETEIRRIVEQSQKFESLVLYRNPAGFADEQLSEFWLTESNFESDLDINKIRQGVARLQNEGKYYGNESKSEQFEIQSVEINEPNDFAVVKTLEKWFIAEYFEDGTLHKNKTVGPYFVTYILRKIDGKWLIEKSSTARAKPSPAI